MTRFPLTIALILALVPVATAGPASDLLAERQTRIEAFMKQHPAPTGPERQQLAAILAELIDFPEMAERVLGSQWNERTPEERAAFVSAFERLVRASSVRRVDIYKADAVRFGEESVEGEATRVRSTFETAKAVTEVDYEFHRSGGGLRIADYVIDGVSAANNYRRQFRKILKEHGWSELLDRLDKRSAELEAEQAE